MKNDTVTRAPRRSCLGVSKPEGGLSLNRTSTLGRVLASMVALAVTSGISLGLSGQASAAPQSPAANPDQAKVAELQEQDKAEASPEDYQRAVEAYDQRVAGKAKTSQLLSSLRAQRRQVRSTPCVSASPSGLLSQSPGMPWSVAGPPRLWGRLLTRLSLVSRQVLCSLLLVLEKASLPMPFCTGLTALIGPRMRASDL